MSIFENQTFENLTSLAKAKYDDCTFVNCHFTESDFGEFKFLECTFEGCDLSNVKLNLTAFNTVIFKNCKLLGLRFEDCRHTFLALEFTNCMLNFSSFYQLKLPKTTFDNCQLQDVDFSKADFSKSNFENCDLKGAIFDRTNLEGADLRTAYNFDIHPIQNRIKKARFSNENIIGLLRHFDIKIN